MNHTKEFIIRAHNGDKDARDTLVQENMGLVLSIAKRFLGRGYEFEDISQIGVIGLIKAIDNFDTEYDVKFSTYAVPLIQGEIKRFLRDDGMVKVSRSIKENGYKVRSASDRLSQQLGRDATIDEIAATINLPVEDIIIALEANVEVDSIYRPVYQSDGKEVTLADKLLEQRDGHEEMMNRMLLEQLLDTINEEEKEIIRLRYYENITQSEVAKILGISQVQVSRMEKKILLKMRNQL